MGHRNAFKVVVLFGVFFIFRVILNLGSFYYSSCLLKSPVFITKRAATRQKIRLNFARSVFTMLDVAKLHHMRPGDVTNKFVAHIHSHHIPDKLYNEGALAKLLNCFNVFQNQTRRNLHRLRRVKLGQNRSK